MAKNVSVTESSVRREVVTIPNRKGERMYAVVTSPAREQTINKLIIFCYTGVNCKTGPGGSLKWLGDQLSAEGYAVLRFDQSAVGDSQGELTNDLQLREYFRMIQSGLAVADTIDVLEWAIQTYHPTKIYLLGYCGGCITAAIAAVEKIEVIAGVICIALPVLYSQIVPTSKYPNKPPPRGYERWLILRGYVRRLLDWRSWVNLFTGKTDWNLLLSVLTSCWQSLVKRVKWCFLPKNMRLQLHPSFNQHFWQAFQQLMRARKRIVILMAELDDETPDFNDEFKTKVLDQRPDYAELCTLEYLPKTDHAVLFEESRNNLEKVMLVALSTVFE
jgi:pimeloyl-ACP methyl ester carboxylesterase